MPAQPHPDSAPRQPPVLPSHLPTLDGLRGLAIVLVLLHQLGDLDSGQGLVAYIAAFVISAGWTGVQLFFVLSGFLITGILLDTQRATNYFSGFYARRALRILPLYFGLLGLAFVVLPLAGLRVPAIEQDLPGQVWLWTFTENWALAWGAGSSTFTHLWSLAVEEQFYLLWPLLMRGRTPTQCLRWCLAMTVFSLVLRCAMAWRVDTYVAYYYPTLCRMDALALGGAVAAILRLPVLREQWLAQPGRLLWAALALLLVTTLATHGLSHKSLSVQTVGFTAVALAFALLLAASAGADRIRSAAPWAQVLRWPALCALGRYSFAIYLMHKPLHDLVGRPLLAAQGGDLPHSLLLNGAYILASGAALCGMAALSYRWIEAPLLGLKRHFVPRI